MNTPIDKATPKRAPKPYSGMEIVWRFKENKGWRHGHIRGVLAKGRILEISESKFASWGIETVALDDIDWYIK